MLTASPIRRVSWTDKHHQVYPSQTKIWEGGTKDDIRIVEALFKGVSTRFWRLTIEQSVENPDFIFRSSFQNLRLGRIHFDRHIIMLSSC